MGSIAFGRHIDDGAFSEPDLDLLRALGPHIRRAVSINRLLDYHAIRAATFEAVLESVGSVVVLVDRALRVIHVNRAGREALEMRAPLFVRQGVLQLADRRAAMRLAEAVEAVEQRAGGLEQRIAIPLRTTGGEAFVIHVLPIQPRQLGTLVPPSAVAALFLASAASPAPPPIAAFAELYDLTPAEARIAELIAEGLAPAEIAGRIGAAPATVRTHLLRVFQKSGVSRQGDLAVRIRAFAGPASTA